jgi:steroid delta-isomerase
MLTPEQMIAAVHAYVDAFDQGDADLAVAIFADDATVEDPIGSPPHVGTDAIRNFYTVAMSTGAKLTLTGPIGVATAHAAFPMRIRLNWDGRPMTIDVIDTFAFDASGKVSRMQAYFGPINMADVRAGE